MTHTPQIKIPATYMRGGTSKGVFFRLQDLPERCQAPGKARDKLFQRVIGSPDPYGAQIDGMGGATSSTSKCVILSKSTRPEHDVDYLYGQVSIDKDFVDWSGNCGNLSSAAGAIAFRGNTLADGTANSIHLNQNTHLLLQGDGNIYFDDPISSGTGGNNSLVKTGSSFVQFAGVNVLNTANYGDANITGGVFRIVQNGSFSGVDDFTVASAATLAGGGTISANNFTISGTLAPDSDHLEIPTFDANHTFAAGRDTVDADKLIGTLTLEGNVDITSATLHFDTQLGDDSSPTDKVVITGTASGTAQIVITPVSPSQGGQTSGTGIVLVEATVGTSDDAFVLSSSPLIAGNYAYTLSVSESSGRKFFVLKSEPYAGGSGATAIPALPAPLLLALALLLPAGVFAIRRREFPQE